MGVLFDFLKDYHYWVERCIAAEEYIKKSPCDPDITEEQQQAYNNWQSIVKREKDESNNQKRNPD